MPLAEALICIDKLGGDTTTTTYNGETIYGNTLGKLLPRLENPNGALQ
jgi:hypothetical protein